MRLADTHRFIQWADHIQEDLEPSARSKCSRSMRCHQQVDGGFSGRSERSDLYYTFFATASLALLGEPVADQTITPYLDSFGDGTDLDLVHACCLLRCRDLAKLTKMPRLLQRNLTRYPFPAGFISLERTALRKHILRCMEESNSIYDAYLGVSSLGIEPDAKRIETLLRISRCPDGGYGAPGSSSGTVTVTAAALMLALAAGVEDQKAVDWLLAQACDGSGFRANPGATIPDLLSTASAVDALCRMGQDLTHITEGIADFTESCWGDGGGFCASPCEPTEDPEYTFYGLVTLACLLG